MDYVEMFALWVGWEPHMVLLVLGLVMFIFARWGLRNPWGFLKFLLIVVLLGGATYMAVELTQSGVSGKKSMSRDIE
jgi:hypothetical protein